MEVRGLPLSHFVRKFSNCVNCQHGRQGNNRSEMVAAVVFLSKNGLTNGWTFGIMEWIMEEFYDRSS